MGKLRGSKYKGPVQEVVARIGHGEVQATLCRVVCDNL